MLNPYELFHLKGRKLKDKLILPLVKCLDCLNIRPNHFAWMRLVLVLIIFYYINNFLLAFFIFALILLTDALDGTLARYRKEDSDKGAFVDVTSDNIVHMVMTYALMLNGYISIGIAGLYLVLYPLTNLLSLIWFNEKEKSDWIIRIRPNLGFLKAPLILCFLLLVIFEINVFNPLLYITNLFYLAFALYYFYAIQARWSKK